jgi:protein required for attachment to host cells
MTPTSFIIVADRGGLKAYRVEDTPNRGASLQLVQALELTGPHTRLGDTLTDQAGRFPVGDGGGQAGSGRHMNGIAERTGLELENEKRTYKQLADHITDIIQREKPLGWSFAAPAAIHDAISELLPPPIQNRVVEHVKSDLLKIEPAKLPTHFRSLQPL